MDFENDEEDVLEHLDESLDKLDSGLPVESVDHAPGTGDNHSNIYGLDWFTKVRFSIGEAMVNADLGFLGAPAKNPNLMPGEGPDFSTVRYAEGQYAYTNITKTASLCGRCGRKALLTFGIDYIAESGSHTNMGSVSACRICDKDHWLITKHLHTEPFRPFSLPISEEALIGGVLIFLAFLVFIVMY